MQSAFIFFHPFFFIYFFFFFLIRISLFRIVQNRVCVSHPFTVFYRIKQFTFLFVITHVWFFGREWEWEKNRKHRSWKFGKNWLENGKRKRRLKPREKEEEKKIVIVSHAETTFDHLKMIMIIIIIIMMIRFGSMDKNTVHSIWWILYLGIFFSNFGFFFFFPRFQTHHIHRSIIMDIDFDMILAAFVQFTIIIIRWFDRVFALITLDCIHFSHCLRYTFFWTLFCLFVCM